MFFKIGALLIAGGVTACALLVLRQSRIQAAHEIARAQLRIRDLDAELWELRPQIAARVAPENVRAFVEDMGTMRGILPEAAMSPEVQRQIDAWRARTGEAAAPTPGRPGERVRERAGAPAGGSSKNQAPSASTPRRANTPGSQTPAGREPGGSGGSGDRSTPRRNQGTGGSA